MGKAQLFPVRVHPVVRPSFHSSLHRCLHDGFHIRKVVIIFHGVFSPFVFSIVCADEVVLTSRIKIRKDATVEFHRDSVFDSIKGDISRFPVLDFVKQGGDFGTDRWISNVGQMIVQVNYLHKRGRSSIKGDVRSERAWLVLQIFNIDNRFLDLMNIIFHVGLFSG